MRIKEKRMKSFVSRANVLTQAKKQAEAAKVVNDGLAPYDMRMVYSLMYGMKITNNFLKMHGGIMVRNAARRKYRRK